MSKYSNIHCTVQGKSFQSKLEGARYQDLFLLEKAGEISDLQCQVPFRLDVNSHHICTYYADFVYLDRNGKQIVEDTKSPATVTPEFRLKEKLMVALFQIKIVRIYAPKSRLSGVKRKIPSRRLGR